MPSNLKNYPNRKIVSHEDLIKTKSASDTTKSQLDIRGKRIKSSSGFSFLKKSAEIFQTYKAILNKPVSYNIGDADTFFKHSLRNYDDFEITKSLRWEQKHLRSDKLLEPLRTPKKNLFQVPLLGQGDIKQRRKRKHQQIEESPKERKSLEEKYSLYSLYRGEKKEELTEEEEEGAEDNLKVEVLNDEEEVAVEETELEEFYSPNSQQLEENNNQEVEEESAELSVTCEQDTQRSVVEVNKETLNTVIEEANSENNSEMAEDEELTQVEDLVQQAGSELSEVVAENPSLQEALDLGESAQVSSEVQDSEAYSGLETSEAIDVSERMITESEDDGASGTEAPVIEKTTIAYDANIDATVIKELEDAERQAMETAKIIYELKQRVAQLLSKSKMTEVEARELEEKNRELRDQMSMFETKTKRIQFLVDQANLFENMVSPRPPLETKHHGDMLPKVIICGTTENNMPKIIVCDDKKKKQPCGKGGGGGGGGGYPIPSPVGVMPQFAKRLSESYNMQERLAAENADLEGKRYQLQEDLLDKDQTVESLQRKLNSLQGEMRLVCKENSLLAEKLQRIETCPAPCRKGEGSEAQQETQQAQSSPRRSSGGKKMPCGKNRGPCPADVESRLQEYSETTQQLEKQLNEMETEVRNMQSELMAVQKERQQLEQHRKMMCAPTCVPPPACGPPPCPPPPCSGPCAPSPCGGPCAPSPCGGPCAPPPCAKPPCMGPCSQGMRKDGGGSDQQLRELREQYNRLQDDYKSKLTEVAGLRADTEKLRQCTKHAEDMKKSAEDKLREYEKELKNYKLDKTKFMGSKEQLIEQEQQLNVAKQRFREAQDELEELRALIQDQQAQLDDYRNKYLQAQQQVEEQRRQIDMMEMENSRISEQVNMEIQRVKNQFQEKLQELTPLPDILKATQIKLQEAQQMHLLAERNNEALVHELQAYKDKAAAMADQMERVRSDQQLGADEKASITQRAEDLERKFNEAMEDNDRLAMELARMEEIADQNEKRAQEKLHEIAQLVSQLETVREESARQVARTKDRCETVRRSMQNQIADLERQLAQSRAQARAAQKDRDDIRQKMQAQINNLNENFEDAQMRIRNLQGHVNFLKSSYTTVFPTDMSEPIEACDCGNPF